MKVFSRFYQRDIKKLVSQLTPKSSKVLTYSNANIQPQRYDYIVLPNTIAHWNDIQFEIKKLKKYSHKDTRFVVIYFNQFWKPILNFATKLGLRKKEDKPSNWLSTDDIVNVFNLEGFDVIRKGKRFLLPIDLGIVTSFINTLVAKLPLINDLCLTTYIIFKKRPPTKEYSVSIIIPARNEQGNIPNMISKIPKIGKNMEIIFVEGKSKDKTYDYILKEINKNKENKNIAKLYKQQGVGKADAVRLGFKKAKNDILIILDADLTVNPKDLIKFYEAISKGYCDFANGSRLVYPLEKQAMQTLNFFGNKIFSFIFTYLLDQKVNDTLCGTKALFRKDYIKICNNRNYFGNFDPFGDYDLLFGATKLNLKICEIPARYRERTYGQTNINRYSHGWLLLKMTLFAAKKLKFI